MLLLWLAIRINLAHLLLVQQAVLLLILHTNRNSHFQGGISTGWCHLLRFVVVVVGGWYEDKVVMVYEDIPLSTIAAHGTMWRTTLAATKDNTDDYEEQAAKNRPKHYLKALKEWTDFVKWAIELISTYSIYGAPIRTLFHWDQWGTSQGVIDQGLTRIGNCVFAVVRVVRVWVIDARSLGS